MLIPIPEGANFQSFLLFLHYVLKRSTHPHTGLEVNRESFEHIILIFVSVLQFLYWIYWSLLRPLHYFCVKYGEDNLETSISCLLFFVTLCNPCMDLH